jgi:hypothetical protein
MEMTLNIFGLFFMLSGMAAWIFIFLICGFYWMCQRPPKEK